MNDSRMDKGIEEFKSLPMMFPKQAEELRAIAESVCEHMCSDLDSHAVSRALKFEKKFIIPKINESIRSCCERSTSSRRLMRDLKRWFRRCLFRMLTEKRASQLFDIVVEFPDSSPAAEDLRFLLRKTSLFNDVGRSLARTLSKRLCHAGASSMDIVQFYISLIQVLSIIDVLSEVTRLVGAEEENGTLWRHGTIAEIVVPILQEYLKLRGDTIKCVVAALVENTGQLLKQEVENVSALASATEKGDENHGWNDVDDANSWKSLRIASALCSLCPSKKAVIEEHQVQLGESLLSLTQNGLTEGEFVISDRSERKEIGKESYGSLCTIVELLKSTFGDSLLRDCSIMLQDAADSQRLLQSMNSNHNADEYIEYLEPLVLSHQYWPTSILKVDEESEVKTAEDAKKGHVSSLPLGDRIDSFVSAYTTTTGSRKISFLANLGFVEMEIPEYWGEDGGSRLVPMLSARVMIALVDQMTKLSNDDDAMMVTIDNLSSQLELEESQIRRAVGWWVARRILVLNDDDQIQFQPHSDAEQQMNDGDLGDVLVVNVDEDNSIDDDPQKKASFDHLKGFVTLMLTNLDVLPVERIHTMLKLWVSDPSYEGSMDDTLQLVLLMVSEGSVEKTFDDTYALKK